MKTIRILFLCHIVFLILASTNFTVISWLWGNRSYSWSYFEYTYRHGWGYAYVSNYSIWQVLCYLAAYGLGAAAFRPMWKQYQIRLSALATILCCLGILSFLLELTHWLWSHHLSWIASFPVVIIVLWIIIGVQLWKVDSGESQQFLPIDNEDTEVGV